jgi:hypothetical protein
VRKRLRKIKRCIRERERVKDRGISAREIERARERRMSA